MEDLYEKLRKYCDSDYYPFHMPGHKRRLGMGMEDPFGFDITEIEGFDISTIRRGSCWRPSGGPPGCTERRKPIFW